MNSRFQTSLACLAFALMLESGSAQLTAPSAGFIRQRDGALRRLDGMTGSYLLGPAVTQETVIASTFDADGGMIQTAGAILVLDSNGRELARFDAPAEPAILSARLAYYSADRTLWSYSDAKAAVPLPLGAFEGTVIAIGGSADGVSLAVRRDDGVWRLRVASDGSISAQESIPADITAVLFAQGGLAYAIGAEVAFVDDVSRIVKRWKLSSPVRSLVAISGAAFQVSSESGSYLIRIDRDRAFNIPEGGSGDPQ